MNCVLLSVGEKVGVDKNRGNGESADGGGCGGRAIADQRNNLTRFMMHGKLMASGAELAAEKAASNRGRGRGSGPGHSPKRVGQVEASGEAGRERGGRRGRRHHGGSGIMREEGARLYIKGPT